MGSLVIRVPGIPQSKGSRQALPFGGKAGNRHIVLVEAGTKRTRSLKALWYATAAKAAKNAWKGPPIGSSVIVSVAFRFLIPKSRQRGKRALKPGEPHTKYPDLDKLCRAIGDALVAADVLKDDALIFCWHARKIYCVPGNEGAEVLLSW